MAEAAEKLEAESPRSGIPPAGEPIPPPRRRGGKTIVLDDGREWIFPPFSMGQIHGPAVVVYARLLKLMLLLAEGKAPEVVVVKDISGDVIELAKMSLDRNYPQLGLTSEDVGDLITTENAKDILRALYDMNGFVVEVLRRLGIASPQTAAPTETPGKTG